MRNLLVFIVLILGANAFSQDAVSGKRVKGAGYASINGTYGIYSYGVGINYDRFLTKDIILNFGLGNEFGNFEHSRFNVLSFYTGASYGYSLKKSIYVELRAEAFVGQESEKDGINEYKGLATGLVFSPEIEYYISNRFTVSLFFSEYIDVISKFSSSHQCAGIKLSRRI